MQRVRAVWLASSGLLLVFVGVFSAYYAGPALLEKMIIDSVVLEDDSEALRRWTVMPQPLIYHTYLFHVENPDEVTQGAKPIVTEKGPYVYDLYRERVDLQFHERDDTVSYYDKTIYRFNQNKSGCRSENDEVTVLNAPILGTGQTLQKIMPMALSIFNDAIPGLFPSVKNAFITAKVKDILFDGVFVNCSFPATQFPEGLVCQGMSTKAPVMFRSDGNDYYFSMFNHMNGTDRLHRVRVSRGRRDPSALGRIQQFGNGSRLPSWRQNTPCTRINGTDTTIFKPFIQAPEKIPIFVSGSCRSMYATYERGMALHGIGGLHYVADPNMLASGRDYPPNRCFCPPLQTSEFDDEDEEERKQESSSNPTSSVEFVSTSSMSSLTEEGTPGGPERAEGPEPEGAARRRRRQAKTPQQNEDRDAKTCLPKGALDMTSCFGSPVILTLPHFYLGAPEFNDYVSGMKADKEKHETFLDIEPLTGIPLRGGKRVQLNMFLEKIESISVLSAVSEGLFPILWVEEGIELEGSSLEQLVSASRRIRLLVVTPWVLLGLGAVLAVAGALLHAHDSGACSRVLAKGRSTASGAEYPPTGPPPGNYGYSLGFGPPNPNFAWGKRSTQLGSLVVDLGAWERAGAGGGGGAHITSKGGFNAHNLGLITAPTPPGVTAYPRPRARLTDHRFNDK